eukprot:CAMPEP_0196689546 /NCGR_PEP_ID=MMETSP1090-20130531/18430_1 /TAXON_ID=37098 /ORGANISM="Isochrysis sp, Strain CCMP1244" /LENGTH=186 /DNA_ID=CAMNT_0042028555 /DNA_START=117 /DNA_END=677 /DNA_ORIENTATION=-
MEVDDDGGTHTAKALSSEHLSQHTTTPQPHTQHVLTDAHPALGLRSRASARVAGVPARKASAVAPPVRATAAVSPLPLAFAPPVAPSTAIALDEGGQEAHRPLLARGGLLRPMRRPGARHAGCGRRSGEQHHERKGREQRDGGAPVSVRAAKRKRVPSPELCVSASAAQAASTSGVRMSTGRVQPG